MTRKYLLLILFSSYIFSSGCGKSLPPACGGHDPIAALPWLKIVAEELDKSPYCSTVTRGFYNKQSIFISAICEPNINSTPLFYDCEGNLLNLDPLEVVLEGDVELIWKKQ